MLAPTKTQVLYNGKEVIDFYEGQHKYTKHGSSEWLTSVTAVTGLIDKSQFLIPWAVNLFKGSLLDQIDDLCKLNDSVQISEIIEIASKQHDIKKKEAADIGTQIHEWCEEYIKAKVKDRKNIELPTDEKVLNGVTAFLRWIKKYKVEFISSEQLVYSRKYNYVGLLDLKAKVNGKLCVVDFKSSKYVYDEFILQVSAYLKADAEESKTKYDGAWIVKFGKDDGEFSAYQLPMTLVDKAYEAFIGLLATKNFLKIMSRKDNKLIPESL